MKDAIALAEKMLSEHIEEFHDFDYEPHQVPAELASLRGIQHHLLGTLMGDEPKASAGIAGDPTASKEWNEGCDFAMEQLCRFLGVDPSSVSWDAATETVDGDVQAVIGNILCAKFGDDWEPNSALAKCEDCGSGPCETCMNSGYQHPHRAELALAADELAKLPGDVYWLFAKGRTRPDEPLWGIGVTNQDGDAIAEAEGDHPADVVRAACSTLSQHQGN